TTTLNASAEMQRPAPRRNRALRRQAPADGPAIPNRPDNENIWENATAPRCARVQRSTRKSTNIPNAGAPENAPGLHGEKLKAEGKSLPDKRCRANLW